MSFPNAQTYLTLFSFNYAHQGQNGKQSWSHKTNSPFNTGRKTSTATVVQLYCFIHFVISFLQSFLTQMTIQAAPFQVRVCCVCLRYATVQFEFL